MRSRRNEVNSVYSFDLMSVLKSKDAQRRYSFLEFENDSNTLDIAGLNLPDLCWHCVAKSARTLLVAW
jgi:hypothetical protein